MYTATKKTLQSWSAATCALLGAFVALSPVVLVAGPAKQPNIIVIFTDDHGYPDIGAMGILDDLKTPHVDSLATGGVRMSSGYVSAPQCVPSRAGLLSGQYQNRFGLETNTDLRKPEVCSKWSELKTIPERLKAAGYATGMMGKWHLSNLEDIPNHGFDHVFACSGPTATANVDLDCKDRPMGEFTSGLYHLDACSRVACGFIRRYKDKPFFYVAYRAPHTPLDAPKKYLDRFPGQMPERRRHALAMISAVDDGVGDILATLREYDLEESTLIFYIGDNGAPLKIHCKDEPISRRGGGWDGSYNKPLNGEKGTLMEGGTRVPFVVYWRGTIPGGQVYQQPVISLDVAATAIAVAGLPESPELDGVNLLPFLTGKKTGTPHTSLFWEWSGQFAVRSGKWKYIRFEKEYLFDVEADLSESDNLVAAHPAVTAKLRQELEQWCSKVGIQKPTTGGQVRPSAKTYFDWYLDGKRGRDEVGVEPEPVQEEDI